MAIQKEVLICDCNLAEHNIIIFYENDDPNWNELYINYHLVKKPLWQRIIYGIKYIFGYQSKLGAYDELVLAPDEHNIKILRNITTYLEKKYTTIKDNKSNL